MAPVSFATSMTRLAGTNRNSGSRSMKRVTSQGQAMRSIFGRSRVTHFMVLPPLSFHPERLVPLRLRLGPADAHILQYVLLELAQMPTLAAPLVPLPQQCERTQGP